MNLRDRFLKISDFLKPYQRLWQNEIMLMYPKPLDGYSMDWIEELRRFKDKNDLIRLEKKDVFELLQPGSLKDFHFKIEELCRLPQAPELRAMGEDRFTWLYIIPKKQHEIRRLAPHLNDLFLSQSIEQIVDVGGGIGLLAQTMNNYYKLPVVSVDKDLRLQQTGSERHKKNAKDPSNMVQYKNFAVAPEGDFPQLLKGRVLPVGLHTCGKLALDLIQVSSKQRVPALVNFGCCYHTLDLVPGLQNISTFARTNAPLWMNKFALTLACRAHRKMDDKDFDLKHKVKLYRYGIHVLLHDHYEIKELVTLGNSSPKLYDESFGVYVFEQLKRLKVSPRHSIEELNAFFADPDLQLLIEQMLAAGLIRNALGRALELYLILDRAIFLEEEGYNVRVEEFFDEEVSPRNIGITAVLP